jgi:hypothetical protein
VLDSLGVKYDLLPDFAQLSRYRVLLIGAEALDQTALAAGGALRAWVEQGGRVVCFEQSYEGELPFAPGCRLARRGNSFFADLIAMDHPAVAGFRAWHWELWNSLEPTQDPEALARAERLYDTYVLPMSEGVIVSGGDRGAWSTNPRLGMVVAEVKQGKGGVFFSQAKATARCANDSIAQQYLRNVLGYVLPAADRAAGPASEAPWAARSQTIKSIGMPRP